MWCCAIIWKGSPLASVPVASSGGANLSKSRESCRFFLPRRATIPWVFSDGDAGDVQVPLAACEVTDEGAETLGGGELGPKFGDAGWETERLWDGLCARARFWDDLWARLWEVLCVRVWEVLCVRVGWAGWTLSSGTGVSGGSDMFVRAGLGVTLPAVSTSDTWDREGRLGSGRTLGVEGCEAGTAGKARTCPITMGEEWRRSYRGVPAGVLGAGVIVDSLLDVSDGAHVGDGGEDTSKSRDKWRPGTSANCRRENRRRFNTDALTH